MSKKYKVIYIGPCVDCPVHCPNYTNHTSTVCYDKNKVNFDTSRNTYRCDYRCESCQFKLSCLASGPQAACVTEIEEVEE